KFVKGSVVPSMRVVPRDWRDRPDRKASCFRRWRPPARSDESVVVDLSAIGGRQFLEVLVADGQRIVVGGWVGGRAGRSGLGRRRRGGWRCGCSRRRRGWL